MASRGLVVPDGYVTYESMALYGPKAEEDADGKLPMAATRALLHHPQGRPTAIFCWRDEAAMFAIRACRKHGLRVPEDISVVGFSDITAAHLFDPPLSTVKSPWEGLGRMAMRQILHRVSEEFTTDPSTHLVASSFVARESTGPAPL